MKLRLQMLQVQAIGVVLLLSGVVAACSGEPLRVVPKKDMKKQATAEGKQDTLPSASRRQYSGHHGLSFAEGHGHGPGAEEQAEQHRGAVHEEPEEDHRGVPAQYSFGYSVQVRVSCTQ